MPQKYVKPALNLTIILLAATAALTIVTALLELPAGWVLFLGVLIVAWAHPAPTLTGPKETPANKLEERQVRRHRSWLDTRTSLLLGNTWGRETLWPGIPPRLSFFVSMAIGLLITALPLSGDVPALVLEKAFAFLPWDAPAVSIPWWVPATSGFLTHHVIASLLARSRRIQDKPAVTIGRRSVAALWSSTSRPYLLVMPLAVAGGAWAVGYTLTLIGQTDPLWHPLGVLGGGILAGAAVIGRPLSSVCLARWRAVTEARAEWAPRFQEAFNEKDGAPRLVERTIAPCGAIVDVMDAPPKIRAEGLQERAELMSAAYGDPSTVIDVLSSPNLDASGRQIPGTAHQLRSRVVQWPEGSFPNLLDPDIDDLSRDLALEAAMSRALDEIGINRMVLTEATQVAALPQRVDPRVAEASEKRDAKVRKQIDKLGADQDEERDRLESSLSEPIEAPPEGVLGRAWRWVRGASKTPLVYPEDSPLAIWKTSWVMPKIPTPPWQSIQAEHQSIAQHCSTVIDEQAADVDAVVDRREGFVLVGDPLSDDAEYTDDSGLTLQQVRNIQSEIEWEQRWQQTLPQGFMPPTTRFEITRDVELPQRFSRDALTLHEQLFATKTGLDAGDTYIDPRGKDFEKGMRTSITGAQMVSIVGWPGDKEGQGSRHPHLFVVRWSTQPVPTTPQDVTPTDGPAPVATSAPAWVLSHLVNIAFRASNVKLPKPEIVSADPLTQASSSKHAWKVTLRLHGGTTLADVRKKADAIRSQLACPWMRIKDAGDGEVTVYMGDPGSGAKLRRGAEVEIRSVDFDQAFVDSNITNLSGIVPALTSIERLATNDEVEVLDFDLPAGVDFAKVKGNREKLRSNLNVEFLDVRRKGASGVRLFMAEHDPLPTRVGIPFDALGSVPSAFGVNALGEQTVFDPIENPHLLVLGGTGSGKSAGISTMLFHLILCGFHPVIIDPTKGGHDFLFAKDWAIAPFAADVYQAASTMKALYGELERRKALNGKHGVVNVDKLPEEVRPRHIVVVIDEFTSLIGKSAVPPKSEDPAADHARLEAEAENNARAITGNIVGKLAREARSVGIHLILGTQKLKQDTLNKMPGGEDLKVNLARMGLGNMTQGDRMSAFRNPLEADTIAEPRVGRGLFEPLTAPHPAIMQVWYEENSTLRQQLMERGVAHPEEDRRLNPADPRFAVLPLKDFVDVVEESTPSVEEVDLDLNIDFDLGALLSEDETASSSPDPVETRDNDQESPSIGTSPESPELDEQAAPDKDQGPVLRLSEVSGDSAFAIVEELQRLLETTPVSEVIADITVLDDESEVGVTYRELVEDAAFEAGVSVRDESAPAAPDPGPAQEPPAPAPAAEDNEEEWVDVGFTPPPIVRGGL
ncbi:FtsK/SpoIIIE domain-containing protein [Brachybacterium kimchii]|uniref:FtsK/SpoIIIE domain-containing protein n=1 Tax=Brachybacterium kimchii TaxID=2942909 RepID=A0ABY4N8V9_9MICO|nr:FtsK/SpoIIIE domain-containing protein [Brachybacterium kimchii]UQN30541.1 FtsK/SpoIIIE domain-containing protein [Brachybacterium kimchii]